MFITDVGKIMNAVFPDQVADGLSVGIVVHQSVRHVVRESVFIDQVYVAIRTIVVNFPPLFGEGKIQERTGGFHIFTLGGDCCHGAGLFKVAVCLSGRIAFCQDGI